jgi:hypothetical protein
MNGNLSLTAAEIKEINDSIGDLFYGQLIIKKIRSEVRRGYDYFLSDGSVVFMSDARAMTMLNPVPEVRTDIVTSEIWNDFIDITTHGDKGKKHIPGVDSRRCKYCGVLEPKIHGCCEHCGAPL